jgi:DNA-binding response OmpR family regulator
MRGIAETPLRALIVDDNVDIASNLATLFQAWGHDVRVAHDGPSAMETARDFHPHAVLLDIGLPYMDGFEVAQRLRLEPEFDRTFIVAASGYSREKDLCRADEVGIDLYLVKPFDPFRLEGILASCQAPS